MPRVWRLTLSTTSASFAAVREPPSIAAIAQDPPAQDANFEDIEADDLRVEGGALVFVENGLVKCVVAAGAYKSVLRLPDTPGPH
jgi:hypothetical protein